MVWGYGPIGLYCLQGLQLELFFYIVTIITIIIIFEIMSRISYLKDCGNNKLDIRPECHPPPDTTIQLLSVTELIWKKTEIVD